MVSVAITTPATIAIPAASAPVWLGGGVWLQLTMGVPCPVVRSARATIEAIPVGRIMAVPFSDLEDESGMWQVN